MKVEYDSCKSRAIFHGKKKLKSSIGDDKSEQHHKYIIGFKSKYFIIVTMRIRIRIIIMMIIIW